MEIQQLVYGYNNGHSLLNSSIDLPQEDKSILLELTDWSGVNELKTPSYITGFPLVKSNFYAFIRTWYAEEMPRPGCAWSHVLLIHKKYFTELTNLEKLFDLFSKPSPIYTCLEDYKKTLLFDNIVMDEQFGSSKYLQTESYLKKLITKLYSTDDPVYLPLNQDIKSLELLFIKLWWMLPINERFIFSFCSGTYTPRKYLNKNIRLQIVEKENLGQISEIDQIFEPWVNVVYKELFFNSIGYIKFINSISDDINQRKNSTAALAQLYELINDVVLINDSQSFVTNLFDSLVKFFPEKDEARKLKRGLLNKNVLLSLNVEEFFLEKIIVSENSSAFYMSDLQLISRFVEIYNSNKKVFFELLNYSIKTNINEFGISILTEAAKAINKNDIDLLAKEYWPLFTIFLKIRPAIMSFSENNIFTESQYLEIINLLLSKNDSNEVNWQFILKIILEREISLLPKMITSIQKMEPDYIFILLDWYNSKPQNNLEYQWIIELSQNADKILDWIESTKEINYSSILLIVQVINPNSGIVIRRGLGLWMPISEIINATNFKNSIYVHAFLTSLAFNFKDSNAFKLLKNSFGIVYNEILQDTLDYRLISMILVHTKPLFWQEWDKCKKLRNALADKFNEAKWETSLLKEIVKKESIADNIEELCKKRR